MLASLAASKTARLIAACVCPVVGAGTLTMAVPKVRNAVHKATAPREYALPKTRERTLQPAVATAPCPAYGLTPISNGFTIDTPAVMDTGPIAFSDNLGARRLPLVEDRMRSADPGAIGRVSGVPEPHMWLQMLVGFTLIGGAARMARKRPTEEEQDLLVQLEAARAGSPEVESRSK